jgi:glycine hydroxymethyltransferase
MVPAPPDEELRLARLVRSHDRWRGREVFNLLASENAVSPKARRYLASDLAGRYTLPVEAEFDGEKIDNSYAGTRYTDQIERLADDAAKRVFRARFATTRPLSGHIAALSVLVPLLERGSRLLAIPPEDGGYDGYAPGYVPAMLGYEVLPLRADGPGHRLEAASAIRAIAATRPAAVLLGQSFFLFPYPLREVAAAAHDVGALVLYDASHVLGLLAGRQFQDPLAEGADVVFGSTHKSFPGPQGGLIVTDREELFRRIAPALVWRTFDNAHWNRIAGVAQTLLELERCGPEYATTVVANARALASALSTEGMPLVAASEGFTASHQVHLDRGRLRSELRLEAGALARRLEWQRLLIDLVGRIGTAEVSRLGLVPDDMARLAHLIAEAGLRGRNVSAEVRDWRRSFRGLRFA